MAIRCPVILAGFQTETLPTAPTLCNVRDGDGRFYEATNIEALNALEDALSRCTLTARDPMSRSRVRAGAVKSTPISTAEREHQASGHWSAAIAAVPFGARQAGRNAERVETMRGLWRCNAHASGELDSLPPGSAIEQMLADYQVMRDQARACR